MYPKEITQFIINCWGKGLTAEETVEAIKTTKNFHIGIATVYRKRNSLTGKELTDELLRQQQRDIADSDDAELRIKFRNELLKILVPLGASSFTQINQLNLTKNETTNIDLGATVVDYQAAIEAAVNADLQANSERKQMDTTSTNI